MGVPKGYKWDPEVVARRSLKLCRPLHVRFERHYKVEAATGCWIWTGSTDRKGYGQLRCGRKLRYATHVALELAERPLPAGMFACHKCDRPACVNPSHLFHGTPKENIRDSMAKGRHVPPPRIIGEKNKASTLTAVAVVDIRARTAAGEPYSQLAREHGVTISCISAVVTRKTWAHL